MFNVRLATAIRIQNQQTWRVDPDTGFLRCTVVANQVGVMEYLRAEFPDLPPDFAEGRPRIRMYVPAEAIADGESLRSLEGTPAVIGHTWLDQNVREGLVSCGHAAGAAVFEGGQVICDLMITDPAAVRRITLPDGDPQRLEEISSAGDWIAIYSPGLTLNNEPYDGVFARVRYNHVALLPKGAGRAGANVRILNELGTKPMELTNVRLRTGARVQIRNEDVAAFDEDQKKTDEKVENAEIDAGKLAESLARVTELNGQIETLTAERDKLAGELEGIKQQLEEATSPAAIEEAAGELTEEREVANKVMNAIGGNLDDVKGLRGHALRSAVVGRYRVANKRPELTTEQAANESFVRGQWEVLAAGAVSAKQLAVDPLAIATSVAVANANPGAPVTADAQLNRLYGAKK